jgi:glutathione S-transferase
MLYAYLGVRPVDPATLAAAHQATEHALDVANDALGRTPFLAGGAFSLADIVWLSITGILFDVGKGHLVTDRPHVAEWWRRVSARPSWARLAR